MTKKIYILLILVSVFSFWGCPTAAEIKDATAPVIKLRGMDKVYLTLDSVYDELGFTATDDIDGDLSSRVIADYSKLNFSVPGTYEIYYNVRDNAGNMALPVVRMVIVGEHFAPTITLFPFDSADPSVPMIVDVGQPFVEPGYSAVDLDGNDLTALVKSDGEDVDTSTQGTCVVTYQITDPIGQMSMVTRPVYVLYPDRPLLTLKGMGLSAEDAFAFQQAASTTSYAYRLRDPGWFAFDRQDGDISHLVTVNYEYVADGGPVNSIDIDIRETANGAGGGSIDDLVDNIYQVEYSVMDSAGNKSTPVYRYCKIARDTTPPVITLVGDATMTVEVDQLVNNYSESGVKIVDAENDISMTIEGTDPVSKLELMITSTLNPQKINKNHEEYPDGYTISYQAVDGSGNRSATITRTIFIVDTKKPVISASGTTVAYGDVALISPVVTDNSGENIVASKLVAVGNDYDPRKVGTHPVIYRAIDLSGNHSDVTVEIIVELPYLKAVENPGFEDSPGSSGTGWSTTLGKAPGWMFDKTLSFCVRWSWNAVGVPTENFIGGPVRFNNDAGYNDYFFVGVRLEGRDSAGGNKNALWFTPTFEVGSNAYYTRSYGKVYQQNFNVFKDVKYSLSANIRNESNNNHQYAAALGVSATSPTAMRFDTDGDLTEWEKTTSVSIDSTKKDNTWEPVVLTFTPDRDGVLDIELIKHDRTSDDRDGGRTNFDDVTFSVVDYPKMVVPGP